MFGRFVSQRSAPSSSNHFIPTLLSNNGMNLVSRSPKFLAEARLLGKTSKKRKKTRRLGSGRIESSEPSIPGGEIARERDLVVLRGLLDPTHAVVT